MYVANENSESISAADVKEKTGLTEVKKKNPYLGSELDFTLAYNYTEGVTIQVGYSQLFGTSTMQTLRGGSTAATANWGYVMLIVRPSKIAFPKVGLKM